MSRSHSFLSVFFFLMIRRPPRSTLDRSSAASDVYKRQDLGFVKTLDGSASAAALASPACDYLRGFTVAGEPVSYTHLRAHETVLDLVCRLLLEKNKQKKQRQRQTSNPQKQNKYSDVNERDIVQ